MTRALLNQVINCGVRRLMQPAVALVVSGVKSTGEDAVERSANNFSSGKNLVAATVWFVLSLSILIVSFLAFYTPAKFIMISLFMLSIIAFLAGCQRTDILRMSERKFTSTVRTIGVAAGFASIFSLFMAGISGQ